MSTFFLPFVISSYGTQSTVPKNDNRQYMETEQSNLIIGYLQGRLDREETDRFYAFVNESAENKRLFFEVKAIYDAGMSSAKEEDMLASWKRLEEKINKKKIRRLPVWYHIGSYAAAILITAVLTSACFFLFSEEGSEVSARYIGGDGLEADVVELPDGTRISLSSKTTFHYNTDYGKKDRIVYLEGEAYFDVAKEKNKPFIVRTKEQDIEALGTKFNVSAYPKDSLLVTTLQQGSILLTTAGTGEQTILKPNEQMVYNRNTRSSHVHQVDASLFTSWTTGYYYFPEQSLEAILERMSHVYGIQFTINSEKLKKKTFTGTFYRGQSIKDIMEIIRLSIPIRYRINSQYVTISET